MATNVAEWTRVTARRGHNFLEHNSVRITALVVLLSFAAVHESFHVTAFSSRDIWWHLRTGLWILQNHAIPHTGLFSQYPDFSWTDSDWGFDILLAVAYRLLALRGIAALLMAFKVLLAFVFFLLARGWSGNFWNAVVLSAAAQYVIVDLQPLPMLVSILFFAVELMLLFRSRRCRDLRPLYWLPLLFFFWANLHMQFLNGLLLLGLYLVAEIGERLLQLGEVGTHSTAGQSLGKQFAIVGVSAFATLLTPYPFQLIGGGFDSIYGHVLFKNFEEMTALAFRRPEHFALLLLVMAAFLTLGRQRSRDLLKIGAMSVFVMLAFRIQRDVWCVALPAIAVIADALADRQQTTAPENRPAWKWEWQGAALLVLAVFVAGVIHLPTSDGLMQRISRAFPVAACDFIRNNNLPAPLVSAYAWGGFLVWYLPEYPVAMDGRLNLYGDQLTTRYIAVLGGERRLDIEPAFARAQTIMLERDAGMTKALTTLPALNQQFRVVYQDEIATVFVRR